MVINDFVPVWARPSPLDRDQGNLVENLGRLGRAAETLAGLAETIETTGIWPMADSCHDDLADGRPLLQLTLKAISVKLIYY